MPDKKSNREKLNEITASIERGIKELFQCDRYAACLRTMSRFHSYSARNTILIHIQRPDATADITETSICNFPLAFLRRLWYKRGQ